jgi:hypothetical protein
MGNKHNSFEKHHCLTMRLLAAISLSSLCVMGTATSIIDCTDKFVDTCTNFCLGKTVDTYNIQLEWNGIDCTQSPCDVAALAAEALAATDVSKYAYFTGNGLDTLPNFSQCDSFVCGDVYDCHCYNYDNRYYYCYNYKANYEGQLCASPDGRLIYSDKVDMDYLQASTSCLLVVTKNFMLHSLETPQ